MKKFIVKVVFLVLNIIILSACTNNEVQYKGGLHIYNWSSSLGGVEKDNIDLTKYSYSINVTNENPTEITVLSIEPVLSETVKQMYKEGELELVVNEIVNPKESIEIKGEIIFNTKELSKQEISALRPFITNINIKSKTNIDMQEKSKD